jgi:hypothetical protein
MRFTIKCNVLVVLLAILSTAESFNIGSHHYLSLNSLRSSRLVSKSNSCKTTSPWRNGHVYLRMTASPKPSEISARLPPPLELVDDAVQKAERLIQDAGGCIDSLSFGAAWKEKYPDFPRDRFRGTPVSSFNKLFKVIISSALMCS